MQWFKKNPIFCSVLLALGLLIILQIAFLISKQAELADARTNLENQVRERDRLYARQPSPVAENAAFVEEDKEAHLDTLTQLRDIYKVEGRVEELFASPPSTNTAAFFEISQWRVDTLRQFREVGMVRDGQDEINLGFRTHATEVSSDDPIERIHRQRKIIDYLIQSLYKAEPDSLIRVRRHDPKEVLEEEAQEEDFTRFRPQMRTGTREGDFFTINPRLTLRRPGLITTEPIEIVFTGQTDTLRTFLDELQTMKYPIFIRNIAAEPLVVRDRRDRQAETERLQELITRFEEDEDEGVGEIDLSILDELSEEELERLRPIIGRIIHRFTVTVEFVQLQESPALQEFSNN